MKDSQKQPWARWKKDAGKNCKMKYLLKGQANKNGIKSYARKVERLPSPSTYPAIVVSGALLSAGLLSGALLMWAQASLPAAGAPPTQAAQATQASRGKPIADKWAVVIGCSRFADPRVPPLKYSAKDAQDFAKFLTDPSGGRFKQDHVKVLTNEDATKIGIMDAIGDSFLPHAALPDDLVVLYLSTHGSPAGADIRGVNYVVAYDTKVDHLFSTGIEMKQLMRIIKERVHTDRILLVMDTCYSGAGGEAGHKGLVRTNVDPKEIAQGTGSLVITSSSPDQRAWESDNLQNSFFTHYLIDSLKDNDGKKTIDQAFNEMKGKVETSVLKEKGEMQTPIMSGDFQGPKLVLAVAPSAPHLSPLASDSSTSEATSASANAKATSSEGASKGGEAIDLSKYARHMKEALNLQSEHKYWDAAHSLELSIKDNPGSVEAYLALAKVYDNQGRFDKFLEAAKRAVVNDSNSSEAHEQLGLAYLRGNNATEALRQLQLAVTLDPENSMAHNWLGYIDQHNFNHSDQAEQEYRRALSLNSLNVRALVNLGLLLQNQSHDFEQAKNCFERAVQADGDDWQAHLALGKILCQYKKDYATAEQEISKAIALDPSNADAHCELANVLACSKEHYDDAENEYRKAMELAPGNASPHIALASFLVQKRNRPEEAERAYRQAIALNADAVEAKIGLGNLLLDRKNFDEADTLFKRVLELNGRNAEAHAGLARVNADLYHNYAGAIDELKKALVLNDKLSYAHEELGEILYHRMNRSVEAQAEFAKAIAIDDNNAEAHFQMGMLIAETDKSNADAALPELQKAVQLAPESPLYETKLGWWHSQFGRDYKEAEVHYRKAIAINNGYSDAHLKLGLLLVEKFGLRKSGDEELRIAHQQDPDNPEIKAAFSRFVGK
jgi:tetratricopeptide (TPR) repeat protein